MRPMSYASFALLCAVALARFSNPAPHAKSASDIDALLKETRLPDGFAISLYARAPGARSIAVGPQGKAIFIGTGADNRIYVLAPGVDGASSVGLFASGVDFDRPHGLCFDDAGSLYVAERNRILRFADAENNWRKPEKTVVVEKGALIPSDEESDAHTSRMCRIGPDGKLYVSLGQPYDVAPKEKLALYDETGIGGVVRMNKDGSARDVFARGIRNSVGMDFNPADGALWFTDNQSNEMGDDTPPGELNRAPVAGLHFGFPWYGGGHARTPEYADEPPPDGVVFPEVEEAPHAADLGMIFYTGAAFPEKYRGGIFSAQHGSGGREPPLGARLMFTPVGPDGRAGRSEPFLEGWNKGVTPYLARPVDVAQTPDGALLVTDDQNGAVYRIRYRPSPIARN
ncbi:PQQ-dependent sugar dehydrogenase [Methylocystis echinoides]|uniref:PQQ-dependent sugar dehydrogenase n=1 Tax=Methylocystis echinoides TaxID=29468 RepID=UPI003440B788